MVKSLEQREANPAIKLRDGQADNDGHEGKESGAACPKGRPAMNRRVSSLDGLRGVAILAVMFFHLNQHSGGVAGVWLFYVLSGYLITSLLYAEHQRTGTISLRSFYGRRVRRIVPALALTLAAYLVLNSAVLAWGTGGQPFGQSLLSILFSAAFVANEAIAYGHLAAGLGHLPTLSLEEQFYAVWPITLLFLLRRRVTVQAITTGVFALAVLMTAYGYANAILGAPIPTWLGPLLNSVPVLIGVGTALIQPSISRVPGARLVSGLAVPAIVTFLLFGRGIEVNRWGGAANLAFYVVCGLLILCLATENTNLAAGKVLSGRPIVEIGKVSYGLYLFHPLLIRTVWCWIHRPVEAELISVPLAFASFYLFERRFLKRKADTGPAEPPGARDSLPQTEVVAPTGEPLASTA